MHQHLDANYYQDILHLNSYVCTWTEERVNTTEENLSDTGNNWRVRKNQTKQERDICKIEPVPSGGIDFSLIKVHNWFNSSKGTFAVKASHN